VRVALDATSLLGPRTGIGTFTSQLLARLGRTPLDGQALEMVAFGVTWRGRDGLRRSTPDHVAVVDRPMAARPLRALWRRVDLPPIEWWTGTVDVVHGPNFVVPPARRAAEVVTVHDLTCVRYPQMCTTDVLQYPDLLRRAVRRGALVHAVSASVAEEVAEVFTVPADRLRVVPNGAPPLRAEADLHELRATGRRIAGRDRYVLALGTLEPRKDLPTLVEAFDQVAGHDPEVGLVVAGPDGWGATAVTDAIEGAAHRTRIRRLGWVDDPTRDALLAGAAVFAYPSLYEGFGLPPLEALAHRTPVVATRAGALPEVLGAAAAWADVGDADALATAICSVLDDTTRVATLLAAGLERLQQYSWDTTAAAMASLYAEAAHG
jgi:glycosyltransferase involved in cell wall biosynthesis